MKRTFCCILVLLEVIAMLSLFGCGKQKHKISFDGSGFESKKTVYAAGAEVTVYYKAAAAGTNYHFWVDDGVALTQDYDDDCGYALRFVMPDHDVTVHVSLMDLTEKENIRVTLINKVEKADVWIMPQTEKNLKSSLWGTATVKDLAVNEQRDVILTPSDEQQTYIIRLIDDNHAYYSVKDVSLGDGYTLCFQTDDSVFDAVIVVTDEHGVVLKTQTAFVGVFGAK